MFQCAVVGYFSSSIYLALYPEIFSNEYELVFYFGGKGGRRMGIMMAYKDGDDFEAKN